MPIRGLTDRGEAFPQIGNIRKGEKQERVSSKGKKYIAPVDLDYFNVQFDEREIKAIADFTANYKPKPTELNIVFPFNDIDRVWDAWMEAYLAGRMIARSDGEYFTYLVDHETGEVKVLNGYHIKTGLRVPHKDLLGHYKTQAGRMEPIKMRPTGRLKVIIRELERLAYLVVHTTSKYDIMNISSQLQGIEQVHGQISGIPLVLKRRPKMISTPSGNGRRARREKWLLSIETDPEWASMKLRELNIDALPKVREMPMLEAVIIDGDADDDYDVTQPPEPHQGGSGEVPTTETIPVTAQDDGLHANNQEAGSHTNPQKQNDNGSERPLSPPAFRERLHANIQLIEEAGHTCTPTQRNMIAVNMETCFAPNNNAREMRKTTLHYLCGVDSVKNLTDAEVLALRAWLNAKPDSGGDWLVDGMAVKEANAVYAEAMKDQGQTEMF